MSASSARFARHRSLSLLAVLLSILATTPAQADSVLSREREVATLADGVYEIRHKDPFPGWVHGNTTVIVGEREVLVVDSCSTVAAAREDIAQIRQWTSKPVRYLVNTHWHQDHNAGNQEYRDAFPGLAIVAHEATRQMEGETAPNVAADITREATEIKDRLESKLSTGKTKGGKDLTATEKAEAAERLLEIGGMLEQARIYTYEAPTLTFAHEVSFDLGGREVQVRHGGRGNTAGDVYVYLPKEKILVTGDLLVRPVPYAFDGYPTEWIRTLESLSVLDANTIVPGHGEVMHDKGYLLNVIALMKSAVTQVEAQLRRSSEASLADVTKAVDLKGFREDLAGGDPTGAGFFDVSMGTKFVELAYHELKQR